MKKIEAVVLNIRGPCSPDFASLFALSLEDSYRIPANCDKTVTKSSTFHERSYNKL